MGIRAGEDDELKQDWKRTKTCRPGGRKRTRGTVQDNEKKIAAKSGRRRKKRKVEVEKKEEEEEEEENHPCIVALDCPSARPSVLPSILDGRSLGPKDGRIADYVHFRFTRGGTRLKRCFSAW